MFILCTPCGLWIAIRYGRGLPIQPRALFELWPDRSSRVSVLLRHGSHELGSLARRNSRGTRGWTAIVERSIPFPAGCLGAPKGQPGLAAGGKWLCFAKKAFRLKENSERWAALSAWAALAGMRRSAGSSSFCISCGQRHDIRNGACGTIPASVL